MPVPVRPLMAHPEFIQSIKATLSSRGTAKQDLLDGVADVQLRILEAMRTKTVPTDLAGLRKLGNKIAADCAIDALRKRRRRSAYEDGLCEDPDAYVADAHQEPRRDPVDTSRLLEILVAQLDAAPVPECAFMILDATAAGLTYRATGEAVGLSMSVVRSRLATMREEFRRRVAQRGLSELSRNPRHKHRFRCRAKRPCG